METYENINEMLSNLKVVKNNKYHETNQIIEKPEQSYTGFSRDVELFSNIENPRVNLNVQQRNELYSKKDKKSVMNERLQNFQPIPQNSPYLSQHKQPFENNINFHLENFKKQQSSEDLNYRLQSRDKVPATQQYSLNKTEHLPIRENLPLSSQDNYVYKPQ